MKKIISIIIALVLIVGVFTVPAFAADETAPIVTEGGTVEGTEVPEITAPDDTTDTTLPDTTETPEITVEGEEKAFYAELVDALTNGANWAKFGGILATVLAVLAVIVKNLSGLKSIVEGVKNLVEGKASKEDTEKLVKNEGEKIVAATLSAINDTKQKQAELEQKYDQQTAILTLVTLQLVKSPYARTEIMKLISTADMQGKNVSEIVDIIEKEIKAAEDAEEKPETPALDSILESVGTDESNGESGVALG